jgi:hypothetical protein
MKESTMTFRQMLTLFFVTATMAAAAQAQTRPEPPESAFVWDALGATPSLRMPQRDVPAATPPGAARDTAARARVSPALQNEFTVDELVKGTPMRKPSAPQPAPLSADVRR